MPCSRARHYDFILIDCPPALNMLTVNGLVAADSVLIPMQCEYYALEGLSDLVETLRKVRTHLNSRLEIEGLLRTMYNAAEHADPAGFRELESHFGRQGLQDHRAAQRPAGRGAVLRQAGHRL
jgi:chromosome partitioning protein